MGPWCLAVFILFFSSCALAGQREAPILAIIDFFPFGYAIEDGPPQGLVFDLEKEIEQLAQLEIDARLMSVPRALRSASIGQNDLLFSYRDDVMVPNVIWLGNLGCLVPLAVHRKDSGIRTLDDLAGKKVGFVGLGYFDTRRRLDWAIEPKRLNNNFIMLKMLVRGRVDVIVVNNAVLNAFLNQPRVLPDLPPDWTEQLAQPLVLDMFETHLSMSRDSRFTHLVPVLRQAITRGREEGRFSRIFKKWGSHYGGHCFTQQQLRTHQWLKQSH